MKWLVFCFYMNNLNANLGISQLSVCDENTLARKQNFETLSSLIPSEIGYFTNHDNNSSYYLATLVLENGLKSDEMMSYMSKKGINCSFHYPFLHKTTHYRSKIPLNKTDSFENRIINLPIHQNLTKKEMEHIANECICYSRSRS